MKDTLTLEPSPAGHMVQGRKELKDEQLFARLIGAAVLLALAVIILPFVLDGSGSQREYEYAETLPAEPQRPESSFSSRQPGQASPARITQPDQVVQPSAIAQSAQADNRAPTRAEINVNVPAITPIVNPQPTQRAAPLETTEQLASVVATAADGGRAVNAAQSSLQTMPLQAGWNIQVASFVREANAATLLRKLREQNLPAYANRVQGSQRTVIRVLVGPYGNQIDALALQNGIDRDYRVESLMVRGR